jgi:hypothetical protein
MRKGAPFRIKRRFERGACPLSTLAQRAIGNHGKGGKIPVVALESRSGLPGMTASAGRSTNDKNVRLADPARHEVNDGN